MAEKPNMKESLSTLRFTKFMYQLRKLSMLSLTLTQLITLFTDNTWQVYTFDMNCIGCGSKTSKFAQV